MECGDGHLHVGITTDLLKCLAGHFNKEVPETAERLPVKIISYVAFENKKKAEVFMRFLKTNPGKSFIKMRWN
jgi:predicted GIY-YIG superfamily endonuclease